LMPLVAQQANSTRTFTMSSPKIYFEFQTTSDDVDGWQTLAISKNNDDTYTAEFKNTLQDTKETAYMTIEDLEDYLELVLKTVTYDDDKGVRIDNVQIDMPMFPSIIVKVKNMINYLPVLLAQINMIHNIDWPISASTKSTSNTQVAETEAAESEASESESEASESEFGSDLEDELKFAASYFKKRAAYEEEPRRMAKKSNRNGRIGYEWD